MKVPECQDKFTQSFSKHLVTYYVPGALLDTKLHQQKKMLENSSPHGDYVLLFKFNLWIIENKLNNFKHK